ncbi:MAG: methyltransferase domain-containing protein [Cyanobacteriota bacterium]
MDSQDSVQSLEESLIKKLNEDPSDFNILNKLGYIYLHSNNLSKSEEIYIRSIVIESNQFEPYVSLGLICTITGRLSRALYFLIKAKQQSPNSDDIENSIDEIKEAIVNKDSKLSKEETDKSLAEAKIYLDNNSFDYALYEYLRLECFFPEDEVILNNIGVTLFKNQDFDIAKDYFEKVLSINNNNPISHHYLGLLYNIFEDFGNAKNHITKSLELKPAFADFSGNGKYGHYKKDYDEEYIENCYFCSSSNFKVINVLNQSSSSFNFNVINPLRSWNKCLNCELIFSNPVPSENAINKYLFELDLNTKKIFDFDIERHIFESNTSNDRLNIIENYIETSKMLDISPNNEVFTSVAKIRGWETNQKKYNELLLKEPESIRKLGKSKKTKEVNKIINTYNLITYWEGFEKNINIKETLEKIHTLLDKDGLFAFSFHGVDTYISQSLGKNHPVWFYSDYFYFFSTEIIKKELAKAGFKIKKIQVLSRKYLSNVEFYCTK